MSDTKELVRAAAAAHRAVGAFNVLHLESAEALVAAAETTGLPVILQISQNCVKYHQGRLAPLAAACRLLADGAKVSVALHLDHAEDAALAREAVDLGFDSVMFDGSWLEWDDNVAQTQQVVAYAHAAGVDVEAELGKVGGKEGAHTPGIRTDPTEARQFAEETGVDLLAVAVGSEHAQLTRDTTLDLELIGRLRTAVAVPLVLHGSSGVGDAMLRQGVEAGMAKINVSTHLNKQFTRAVRERLAADESLVDSRKYLAAGRDAMQAEAERLLRLFAGELPEGE